MAKPLRPKRGTTAKNDAFTGLASEITIDTDKHSIRVHDGVTAGGHEILPKTKNDELYAPKGLDVGVTSFNGSKGAVTYSAPVSSVNGKTGAVTVDVGVTSFNGSTGKVTYSAPVTSVNGQTGAVTISVPSTPKAYITETWQSGASWYRKWSDGWIEQGGQVSGTSITFHKAFSNTNYSVTGASTYSTASSTPNSLYNLTTTGCTLTNYSSMGVRWRACGY